MKDRLIESAIDGIEHLLRALDNINPIHQGAYAKGWLKGTVKTLKDAKMEI